MRIEDKLKDSIRGLAIALSVIGLWFTNLSFLLTQDQLKIYIIIPGILLQTFLYTGLFITAHDAMHVRVYPVNRKFNNLIGTLTVKLYAFFSYQRLLSKHCEHHKHPASPKDPDFHDAQHPGFIRWYLRFMTTYLTWGQILGMAIIFNILRYIFHVSVENLILFWIIPSFVSTIQLFYFGTYLPHRPLEEDYPDEHRARSNDFSLFWSFLTCYHFGYHWEHHEYPHIPWWRLSKVRKAHLAINKI